MAHMNCKAELDQKIIGALAQIMMAGGANVSFSSKSDDPTMIVFPPLPLTTFHLRTELFLRVPFGSKAKVVLPLHYFFFALGSPMAKESVYADESRVNEISADADGGGAHREHRGGEMGEADDHLHLVLLFIS